MADATPSTSFARRVSVRISHGRPNEGELKDLKEASYEEYKQHSPRTLKIQYA